jgi:acetyl-CoA carboxylase biotin carboxyl carrier protein
MDYKSIQELIKTMSDSNLTLLEVESEGVKIKLEKKCEQVLIEKWPQLVSTPSVEAPLAAQKQEVKTLAQQHVNEEAIEEVQNEKLEGILVASPIVGTFYLAPSPEAEFFVKVGSKVKKGDTLCIIEAMKLMNEIEAEMDGEVVEILVKNEQMVEYGQPLFRIR